MLLRTVAGIALALGAGISGALPSADPLGSPAQVAVSVQEHQTGVDIVELTALARDYPPRLLREQALRLAEELGSDARALQVFYDGADERSRFLKARFGVQGLVEPAQGLFRLEPIVRAFAGAPDPYTIENLYVAFVGQRPSPGTLRTYRSPAVSLIGQFAQNPDVVEYRIALLTQNAAEIRIPDRHEPPAPVAPPSRPDRRPLLLLFGATAAVAAGVFAFVVTLRARPASKAG